jgi:predicted ArsR family transcriptional regulator
MKEILQYLKKHCEQLDTEIAVATGISLTDVHLHLSHLVARGEVMVCRSIRFDKEKRSKVSVASYPIGVMLE